jgi:hypothetical protein
MYSQFNKVYDDSIKTPVDGKIHASYCAFHRLLNSVLTNIRFFVGYWTAAAADRDFGNKCS